MEKQGLSDRFTGTELDTIIKRLGGEKAALKLLRGELMVSDQTWRREDGVIHFSVVSDGTTGPEWIKRLEKRGIRVGRYAKDLLRSVDFTQDRSEVSVDGKGKGYVVTDDTIEKVLREKFGQSQGVEARIARAKKVYGQILEGMTETPDLPEYEKVKGFLTENMGDAFSDVPPADKPNFAAEITKRLGPDQATYEQRYKGKLKSRSDWFLQSWEQGMFGIEPEADYAEDLTVYANADERHIFRMADIVNRTTVEIKKVLSDPDNELGFTEMVKSFAKDPYKAIDAMAGYLNKFRKVITRERGPDYAPRYMNYYVTMIVDAAVKDDKFRSGMSFEGFVGIWNNFASATFGKNKQSLATDRFQVFVGKDMDAREGFKIIKFLEQKKLINDEGSRVLRKRLHATIPDIIWEMSPYLAIFFLYTFVQKSIADPLSENLDLDTGGGWSNPLRLCVSVANLHRIAPHIRQAQ
jgi:hypothetical protein